jgi:hypothetical protein
MGGLLPEPGAMNAESGAPTVVGSATGLSEKAPSEGRASNEPESRIAEGQKPQQGEAITEKESMLTKRVSATSLAETGPSDPTDYNTRGWHPVSHRLAARLDHPGFVLVCLPYGLGQLHHCHGHSQDHGPVSQLG